MGKRMDPIPLDTAIAFFRADTLKDEIKRLFSNTPVSQHSDLCTALIVVHFLTIKNSDEYILLDSTELRSLLELEACDDLTALKNIKISALSIEQLKIALKEKSRNTTNKPDCLIAQQFISRTVLAIPHLESITKDQNTLLTAQLIANLLIKAKELYKSLPTEVESQKLVQAEIARYESQIEKVTSASRLITEETSSYSLCEKLCTDKYQEILDSLTAKHEGRKAWLEDPRNKFIKKFRNMLQGIYFSTPSASTLSTFSDQLEEIAKQSNIQQAETDVLESQIKRASSEILLKALEELKKQIAKTEVLITEIQTQITSLEQEEAALNRASAGNETQPWMDKINNMPAQNFPEYQAFLRNRQIAHDKNEQAKKPCAEVTKQLNVLLDALNKKKPKITNRNTFRAANALLSNHGQLLLRACQALKTKTNSEAAIRAIRFAKYCEKHRHMGRLIRNASNIRGPLGRWARNKIEIAIDATIKISDTVTNHSLTQVWGQLPGCFTDAAAHELLSKKLEEKEKEVREAAIRAKKIQAEAMSPPRLISIPGEIIEAKTNLETQRKVLKKLVEEKSRLVSLLRKSSSSNSLSAQEQPPDRELMSFPTGTSSTPLPHFDSSATGSRVSTPTSSISSATIESHGSSDSLSAHQEQPLDAVQTLADLLDEAANHRLRVNALLANSSLQPSDNTGPTQQEPAAASLPRSFLPGTISTARALGLTHFKPESGPYSSAVRRCLGPALNAAKQPPVAAAQPTT